MKAHPILAVLLWLGFGVLQLPAQDQSVKPGINDAFRDPNVSEFVGRFEKEGRDAFDHRLQIVEACRLSPGLTVADIGAGTGLFTRLFAREVGPQGRVYAVDISKKFIEHIERTSRDEGLTNVTGIVCEPDDARLPPESIDVAFICDTYHHFEFPKKTMDSIARAMKPGGRLILIDFIRKEGVSSDWVLNHVRAGQEVFTREICESGFRQVGEKPGLLKESYFVEFEKVAVPAGKANRKADASERK